MTSTVPWADIAPAGPILRPAEAARYLGLGLTSFWGQAKAGEIPTPVKIGPRAVGVPRPWLDAVIADRVTRGTMEPSV